MGILDNSGIFRIFRIFDIFENYVKIESAGNVGDIVEIGEIVKIDIGKIVISVIISNSKILDMYVIILIAFGLNVMQHSSLNYGSLRHSRTMIFGSMEQLKG